MSDSQLSVLVDSLRDYNTKPTILCIFKLKIKNNFQFQEQRARDHCLSANVKR